MTTRYTVTVSLPRGVNPFTQPWSRRRKLLHVAKTLRNLAAGIGGGVEERATISAGSGAATGTVTCAAVANADTVTIDGRAMTATQHHARGTITPTVAGIDVNDTLLINETTLTAKQHHAKGTITCAAADAADNVVVGATTFVGTTGAVTPGAATYSVDTGNNEAAASLAAQINAHAVASLVVTASAASAVVTLRAVASGIAGNSIVLTSTDGTDLAVSGSGTLSGATAPAAGEFDISGTAAQCCTSILAAINASAALTAILTASTTSTVVTIRNKTAGTAGNSVVLTSSDAQLAVSGAGTMTGGAAVAADQFDFGGTDIETATALTTCINAGTANESVTATRSAAIVTLTAKIVGDAGEDVTLATSNDTRLAKSGTRLAGGTDDTLMTF